jgi:glucans biosynthesis protein C
LVSEPEAISHHTVMSNRTASELTAPAAALGREYGLDWLRVAAFAVLIFYHSGMMFVPWEFHIKNRETSEGLASVMLFFNRWRLPLLFFISGCGVFFSLRRRTLGGFATERLRRLLIPLLFGMFVVVPPQIYFERLFQGAKLSYIEFYPSVFQFEPYPKGSLSWHHLWFVAYLLVYSLVGIPLFGFLRTEAGKRAMGSLSRFLTTHPLSIYLINVPSLVAGVTLGPRWPVTHNLTSDWANLIGSIITFLWGFFVAANPLMLDTIERRRREFLSGALAVTALFYLLRITKFDAGLLGRNLINGYFGMLWIFTLVGYARAKIRTGGPWLTYATEAVYPFYILHQTIMIAAGYFIIQPDWGILPKLFLTMGVTFAGSWLGFELVRHNRLTRLLFGLSQKRP